jgi:hypothetical protein
MGQRRGLVVDLLLLLLLPSAAASTASSPCSLHEKPGAQQIGD